MLSSVLIFCILAAVGFSEPNKEVKEWAVLVAGSDGYWNYRHQADICHAYQVLHEHGVPDERVVVFMYDDIANNQENPTKGKIINQPNGDDVYHGVPKDYNERDVTVENFIKVLKGEAPGVGSGKVYKGTSQDHLFINLDDHGAPGLFSFPSEILTVKQLIDTVNYLHDNKRYGKMVIYIEACEAGSMFDGHLKPDIDVFATTASNPTESSWGCYCNDPVYQTCLGDEYSVSWMQDSDKENLNTETLEVQYEHVKKNTNRSHVVKYGDDKMKSMDMSEFLGKKQSGKQREPVPITGRVDSRDVPLYLLKQKIDRETDAEKRLKLQSQLTVMETKRRLFDIWILSLANSVAGAEKGQELLTERRPLRDLDCHHQLAHHFHDHCYNFPKNPYTMKYAYVLVNMCEMGYKAKDAMESMTQFCSPDKVLMEPIF